MAENPKESGENRSIQPESIDPSNAAKALGRLGGLKGGEARAKALSPERRSEIARNAVKARWKKARAGQEPPVCRATHGDEGHPLRLGDLEIPCYVLEDGRRVLAQGGMITSLGMSKGSAGGEGRDRLASFAVGKGLKPFVSSDLLERIGNPIRFYTPTGNPALGYEATILADLCEAVLAAREKGALQPQQERIAKRCEILVRGFARVGIIALVDEATGYQYYRTRKALEEILETYISKELVKWAKTFPDEFYQELYRLLHWRYDPRSSKRPIRIAQLTIDLVYDRLAPFVLDELRRLTPRDERGRLKHKLFQRLTQDVGHPALREHLAGLIVLMKVFDNFGPFYNKLDRAYPKFGETPMLPFGEDGG